MKPGLLIAAIFIQFAVTAQSPYTSFILKMDSLKSLGVRYKIEMKICEPKKKTEIGNWSDHDISKIKFDSLKTNDINCGEWFDKGTPTLISGQKKEKLVNQFEYNNQQLAWEYIYIFKISNISSRGWHPDMYVVMPMKYKSFITSIQLNDLEFQSGKVFYLTEFVHTQADGKLIINQSLKDYKTIDEKKFFLREILK